MTVAFRLLVGICFSATLLAVFSGPVAQPSTADQKHLTRPAISSVFYPEVRLRKLHLVRPDLIPYPIYYEIYC